MTNKTKCVHCGKSNYIKKGLRKTQNRGNIQRYKCLDCNRLFTNDNGFYRMKNDEKKITSAIDRKANSIEVEVTDAFEGFTLAIQLPTGKTLSEVKIDKKAAEVKTKQLGNNLVLYPVLEDGGHRVIVSYQ